MRRRRIAGAIAVAGAWVCVAVALLPLGQMLWTVTANALPALRPALLTTVTHGVAGGLANAIVGTFVVVGAGVLVAVPLGVLGGVYVAERRGGATVAVSRLSTSVLAGVPSIVVGYFGYVTMVLWFGWGFSLVAGAVALAIIMLPYVLRATEAAVQRVPEELREVSAALGATQVFTVRRVVMRSALPGILTGCLIAVGIAVGETAPLIYTAGWSNYMPTLRLAHAPIGYLTYVVWTFINEPYASANALAYSAAFLLMVLVLLLNVVARVALGTRR